MAYEPKQLARQSPVYSEVGRSALHDKQGTWRTFDPRAMGRWLALGGCLHSEGTPSGKVVWWRRAATWFGRGGAAALILTLVFTPVFISRNVAKVVIVETKEQKLVKRVYAEIAPKLFEQLTPDVIMALSKVIVDESAANGFDPLFVVSVIEIESNFKVEAISPSGALGLMQLKPSTFRSVSKEPLMFDPASNVRAGIRYMAKLAKHFKRPEHLLLAYNAGPNGAAAIIRGEAEHSYESVSYGPKVMTLYTSALWRGGDGTIDANKAYLVAQK